MQNTWVLGVEEVMSAKMVHKGIYIIALIIFMKNV